MPQVADLGKRVRRKEFQNLAYWAEFFPLTNELGSLNKRTYIMSFEYPLPNRNTINLDLPTLTLDVNQVTLKPPDKLGTDYIGLLRFEYNYFVHNSVELCVTPQTSLEISKGTPISELGSFAYQRLIKSELYKSRPPEATLDLSTLEANDLWKEMRFDLFPTVTDTYLSTNQISDINQIFCHTASSGSTASNAAFLTFDGNFLRHADLFQEKYGVLITTPNTAWSFYENEYGLLVPDEHQALYLWKNQHDLLLSIEAASS